MIGILAYQTYMGYIQELGIELFIDDYVDFAKQVASSCIDIILYVQPWNENYTVYMEESATKVMGRFASWEEIAKKILE